MKKSDLEKKTVSELRAMAKAMGLAGHSGLAKAKLVAKLLGAVPAGVKRAQPARRTPAPKPAARAAKPTPAPMKKAAPPARPKRPRARREAKPPAAGPHLLSPRVTRAFSLLRATGEQRIRASKYYLGVPESPELDQHFEYPETYGENAITLMVRDPYWLFAYWEFAPDLESSLRARIGAEALAKSRLVLRVYDVTGADPDHPVGHHDIDVAAGARNWYINVMRVERDYCVDLGIITPDGSFIVIARSNRVSLPPVGPSDVVDEEWVTLEALEEFYARSERGPSSGSGGWGSGGFGR